MILAVAIKQVPNLTDDLEISADGTGLDYDALTYVLNEFDEQALEEAVLVKEAAGGSVTVVGIDTTGELDGALHTALAKGADRAMKVTGDFDRDLGSEGQAQLLAEAIRPLAADLLLTGVQAADDRDGQIGPRLAALLGWPYVGVVTHVTPEPGCVRVHKEYAGGLLAEFVVTLPAVIGVQASHQPPRYAPVSKIRQIAKTAQIESVAGQGTPASSSSVRRMFKPEAAGQAEMWAGEPEEVAGKIATLLTAKGLLKL
ncbi:MAG: electron transfer flavoprotein subunit beta [Anaerolineales bacterium]|nr:electron transfer flavoprotein subunit beta [Anaerolineales bacterium]